MERPLTPKEIVAELDKYIIGQDEAKRCVAIAQRNRWRRQQVPKELRDEIAPKNIIMIGPTGVGKTEISRRLAKLAQAPFLKIEASKFTEVGYVGRDVESMIRDLTELAVNIVRNEEEEKIKDNPVVNYHLGMIHLGLGERVKAKKHLQAAVNSKQAFSGKEEAEKALLELTRGG